MSAEMPLVLAAYSTLVLVIAVWFWVEAGRRLRQVKRIAQGALDEQDRFTADLLERLRQIREGAPGGVER